MEKRRKLNDGSAEKQERSKKKPETNEMIGTTNERNNTQIARIQFREGDVIWAKIRGSPHWPAKIEEILHGRTQMYKIYWFNDYRRSKVYGTQIQKFFDHFNEHENTIAHHVGLEMAVKEAIIYIGVKSKFLK